MKSEDRCKQLEGLLIESQAEVQRLTISASHADAIIDGLQTVAGRVIAVEAARKQWEDVATEKEEELATAREEIARLQRVNDTAITTSVGLLHSLNAAEAKVAGLKRVYEIASRLRQGPISNEFGSEFVNDEKEKRKELWRACRDYTALDAGEDV